MKRFLSAAIVSIVVVALLANVFSFNANKDAVASEKTKKKQETKYELTSLVNTIDESIKVEIQDDNLSRAGIISGRTVHYGV